jgi:hypothetical protein
MPCELTLGDTHLNSFLKNKDLLAGLMFIAIGVIFTVGAYQYNIGTAARMGPGYFPRILGVIMAVLGVIIAGVGLKNQAAWSATEGIGWTWKPVWLLTLGVVLFGVLLGGGTIPLSLLGIKSLRSIEIPSMGMIAAICTLIAVSGFAAHDKNYRQLAMIIVIMCIFCAAVFVWGLKLQMKLFPWS